MLCSFALSAQQVILTGILDGTGSGGTPRAVELYVQGQVDLSGYTLVRYSNGSSSATDVSTLSGLFEDEFVYVINNQQDADFTTAFGTSGDFAASNRIPGTNLFGNGDDVFTIEFGGVIIDQTGGVRGERINLYLDSYLYRADGTGPDGDWVPANWMNVGNNNLLDGVALADYPGIVPFGTYTPPATGPMVNVMAGSDLAEPSTDGGFTITLNEASTAAVTVTYTLGGTATAGADYQDPQNGTVTFPAGETTRDVTITVLDDTESELAESITLTLSSVSDATYALGRSATIEVLDDEPVGVVLISAIQGSGNASSVVGQTLSVQGIVVGDFQGGSGTGLGGFFIQEEDADQDGDATTSEGIWVFEDLGIDVAIGDLVTVTGTVSEFGDLTQLNLSGSDANITIDQVGAGLPTPTALMLPADDAQREAVEGMYLQFTESVSITSNFGLARFGEIEVAAGDRLVQYTECNEPDADGLAAYNAAQDDRRLIVDDGRSGDNNFPIVLPTGETLTATNSLRAGTVLTSLTGVMDERFNNYRLQPTADATVQMANARPTTAPNVGGNLTVVGMNVLNYFTTLGRRGADDADELQRQQDKIVAAICELDADILGLVEIENNSGANSATNTLIAAIAAECGKQYTAVVAPNTGTDEIKVVLIYDASVVEESGTAAALTTPNDVFSSSRVPVAQTFRIIEAGSEGLGEELLVTVNHWKSKGGSCGAGDDDNGGAGSCDGTRVRTAEAIRTWLSSDPTGTGVLAQLIIGDLNAYSQEEPITTLTDNGFVNLVRANAPAGSFPCGSVPSYVFRGEWGSLDHALASSELAPLVTGATPWNVNAAEPTALDYDTRFNDPSLYAADFYRFSDHDPIVVGIQLSAQLPVSLNSFTGEEADGRVNLAWQTASEQNVARYDVQRRTATGDYETLGNILAVGNSTTNQDYSFTDNQPFQGTNTYRLRIVDQDGSESFSPLVSVEVDNPNSITVVANGAHNFQLKDAPVNTTYWLTNVGGAVLRQGTVSHQTENVATEGLVPGIYFLSLRLPNGQQQTFKLPVN